MDNTDNTDYTDYMENTDNTDNMENTDNIDNIDNIENHINNIINYTTQSINEIENTEIPETLDTEINSNNIEVFNIALHQYLQIETEIKVLLNAIKERSKKKKNLAETLTSYLQEKQIVNVDLGGSYKGKKLETRMTYSTKGLSKQKVTEILYEELKQESELFDKIMTSIGNNNNITETIKLRICNIKKNNVKLEKASNKIDMAEDLLNDDD